MLRDLEMDPPAAFVDYFRVERVDGRDRDLGYFRHFIDPTDPLIKTMSGHSHGILVTSATLTSGQAEKETALLSTRGAPPNPELALDTGQACASGESQLTL